MKPQLSLEAIRHLKCYLPRNVTEVMTPKYGSQGQLVSVRSHNASQLLIVSNRDRMNDSTAYISLTHGQFLRPWGISCADFLELLYNK
jgi:hypothetical protein